MEVRVEILRNEFQFIPREGHSFHLLYDSAVRSLCTLIYTTTSNAIGTEANVSLSSDPIRGAPKERYAAAEREIYARGRGDQTQLRRDPGWAVTGPPRLVNG